MNSDRQLQELLDKQAIEEVIKTYARALDRMDEKMLRSVFHPGSKHAHFFEGASSDPSKPSKPGAPGDFVSFAMDVLRTHSRTHHQLGNTLIEMESESVAFAETYFTAYHRMRPSGDKLAASSACDTEMDYFVGGRYIDRFEKRGGKWKITHRTGMTDWTRLEPPSSQGFGAIAPAQLGKRGKHDMVYACRKLYR
jgi:SnoaL-like domain